ncbi:hypothetical protein YC2023_079220 [Brassica napus]
MFRRKLVGKIDTIKNIVDMILTTRQAARAFLVIHDYISRLRAVSSLWLARPRD